MLSNFTITRDDPEIQKKARKDFFDLVSVPKVVTEDETIPESLKRVLGNDFYELKNHYIIEGVIQNECIFEMAKLKNNTKVLSFITQGISNIYQGFMGLIGTTVTKELVDSTVARIGVATTSENYVETKITMNDLGEISEYVNGVPMVLKNYKAIIKLGQDIESNRTALQNAPDQATQQNINKKLNEDYQQLTDYYVEVVTGFFKILSDKLGINPENIVDITTVFEKTTATEDGTKVAILSFVTLHSAYNILYRELQDTLV